LECKLNCVQTTNTKQNTSSLIIFWMLGILFGIILIKSEVGSWWRIQEMFRLQNFHMFGVIGSAIATGMLSIFLIKKLNIKTIDGDPIEIVPKKFQKGNIYGGLIFGFGWALTGACPGPLFALIGNGAFIVIVILLSAILGTKVYGSIKHRLPH
jgi:uncharacterized membrane protein YedE/YeeE